jgi:hypothetical protein
VRQQVREIFAGDQFHDEERLAAGRFAIVVDARDVGMIERGRGARLAQEAGAVGFVVRPALENLTATRRARWVSSARYTTPIPPRPSLPRIR